MSLVMNTGRTKTQTCVCCGSEVEHREFRGLTPRETHESSWMPVEHRAPCGAQCAGGGYAGEADVHTPPFKPCPRCGATQSEILHTIERPDGAERVVFHRYKKDYSPNQGFWAIQERRDGDLWRRVMWWDVGHPESFESAVEKAREHVPWLGSALLASFPARDNGHQKIGT